MFPNMKYRIEMIKKMFPYAKGVKVFFGISFLASVLVLALDFINPLFYRMFINQVILERQFFRIGIVAAGYLVVFLFKAALGYLKANINYRMVKDLLFQVKYKIWQGFFDMPFAEYENRSIGDMDMLLNKDIEQITQFLGYQTIDYLIACMTAAAGTILLFGIDWRLALFAVISIPATFWIDHLLSKKERELQDTNRENDQNLSSWLFASVQGWREIKALNLEKSQKRQFVKYLHNYALFFGEWINYWVARMLIIPKIKDEFFMQFGLYFIGGILIINGQLSIGNLLVFVMYYEILSNAVRAVSTTDAELQANRAFTDRLLEELNGEKGDPAGSGEVMAQIGEIKFDRVAFRYQETEKEVLKDLSLTIKKGERVAITGKSGAGKTTVLKLLTGMLYPAEGEICYSGIDITRLNMEKMRRRIGFVMQNNLLFNTTIRENLLYSREYATEEELKEACEKACIYEFIEGLPDGLDTVIGERGIKLSGGQRQRLVLARLFLRDVEVFIFDEATSALDQYSENVVHDAIRNIGRDKIIIVVAHRASSIQLCDRQIVLE